MTARIWQQAERAAQARIIHRHDSRPLATALTFVAAVAVATMTLLGLAP